MYGDKIAETILKHLPANTHFPMYCEPFCGMLGVFRHMIKSQKFDSFHASDIHASVISMWQAVQNGWLPPTDPAEVLTPEMYGKLFWQPSPSPLKAYVGFGFTYRGQFFHGEFRPSESRHRKYIEEFRSICSTMKGKNVRFENSDYTLCTRLTNAVIYADLPYGRKRQSNRYRDESYRYFKFNNESFWNWCHEMSKDNLVFVSEQSFPEDFVAIACFQRQQNVHPTKSSCKMDFLVVHQSVLPRLANVGVN